MNKRFLPSDCSDVAVQKTENKHCYPKTQTANQKQPK